MADYNAKGQKDYKSGKYEPPYGIIDELTTWSQSGMAEGAKNNEEYDAGYSNAKNQSR